MRNFRSITLWILVIAAAALGHSRLAAQELQWRRAGELKIPIIPRPAAQRLTASDAERGDRFGWSVAFSGDTLAVGVIEAEDPETGGDPSNSGAVVVFTRDETGVWTELEILHNPDPGANDYYGQILALSDRHLFVGVPADTVEEVAQAGSVYAYTWDDSHSSFGTDPERLVLTDPIANSRFGVSLAVDGEKVLVGASATEEFPDHGVAFVLGHDGSSWHEIQVLTPSDPENSANSFAAAMAVSDDWLVIGSPGDTVGQAWGAGAAYVFRRNGEAWTDHQRLTASDADWYDAFGLAVAISGTTALISAPRKDHPSKDDAGAVYIFSEVAGNWAQDVQVFSQNPTDGRDWGAATAISGDTAMIGFPNMEPAYAGAVDVLTRTNAVWSYTDRLFSPHPASSGSFGFSLAQSGSDLLIGAPMEDARLGETPPVWDAGAAYVVPLPWLEEKREFKQRAHGAQETSGLGAISGD